MSVEVYAVCVKSSHNDLELEAMAYLYSNIDDARRMCEKLNNHTIEEVHPIVGNLGEINGEYYIKTLMAASNSAYYEPYL